MNEGKPQPQQKIQRRPLCKELMIKEAWKEMTKKHRQEWIKAKDTTKEKILAQRKPQSSSPATKSHQLRTDGRTVYKLDFVDENDNGYYSDCTANSEATYDFDASSSVYDATGDDDSNRESVLDGQELTVSAAAATKSRPQSILKVIGKNQKKFSGQVKCQ